jgi:hypothetical protein
VRSAVDWAEVRAMHVDGVPKREIARQLGISRNTVDKLVEATEPPKYSRALADRCWIRLSRCCGVCHEQGYR